MKLQPTINRVESKFCIYYVRIFQDKDECDDTHKDYDIPAEWNACHEQAVCVNNNAGYTCECNEG